MGDQLFADGPLPVVDRGATFSPDRRYRYVLWRVWDFGLPRMTVIGLNPSTADESEDDQTIRQCIKFARREGWGGLHMINLYAWRSTDPRGLLDAPDPVGPGNDRHLIESCSGAGKIVAAWGAVNPFPTNDRGSEVIRKLERWGFDVFCFGLTKGGAPRHPCRLAASTPLTQYAPSEEEAA